MMDWNYSTQCMMCLIVARNYGMYCTVQEQPNDEITAPFQIEDL